MPLPEPGLTPDTLGVEGSGRIVVESFALAGGEPPPDTATAFTWGDVALDATFTVTVIEG